MINNPEAEKGVPCLLVMEILVILSNIFRPLTFRIDAQGFYQATDISVIEDIYLVAVSLVTAILILRCKRPLNQKIAGLTFIFLPLVNYIMGGATFGNASQYGMILVSLIIMYCIISNEKSSRLAATETELNMATRIQIGALPPAAPEFPDHQEVNLRASMPPTQKRRSADPLRIKALEIQEYIHMKEGGIVYEETGCMVAGVGPLSGHAG